MLLDMDYEHARALLGDARLVRRDAVVPSRFPSVSHAPYHPGYEWLFAYERALARFLLPLVGEHHRDHLFGPGGIVSEALSNAFCHGHRRDLERPIDVRVVVGEAGLIIRIADDGPGFDVRAALERLTGGKVYFHQAGNGLRAMEGSTAFGVFYGRSGRVFHLLALDDPARMEPFRVGREDRLPPPPPPPRQTTTVPPEDFSTESGSTSGIAGLAFETNGGIVFSTGFPDEQLPDLVAEADRIVAAATHLCRNLAADTLTSVHVQAPGACLVFRSDPETERTIVVRCPADYAPALAVRRARDLENHLRVAIQGD